MRGATANEVVEQTVQWNPFDAGASVRTTEASRVAPGAPAGQVVAGRYRVKGLLGTGGMGTVWLAQDEVLQRAVALKQLTTKQREEGSSALREARAATRVIHPGVVQVHDVLVDVDGGWIVMELLPGQPLSSMIRERGRLPVPEVARLALRVLSALQAIHDANLVHRDVKPANIQICGGDRVVLTDFGLSSPPRVLGGLQTGVVTGSLPYLAPETILDGRFGPPSDLYALGVTLYKAVEGHTPFDTSTPSSVLDSVLSDAPVTAEHAGALDVVLDGLLEKDPRLRMDAARARSAIQAVAGGMPTSAVPAWNTNGNQFYRQPISGRLGGDSDL
jgi:eukaryotic-like serine/threonine-protein kinase